MYKILLLMLLSTFINAEWLVNNKVPLKIDNIKSMKGLSVQLWLTDKESELLRNWNTESEKVILPSINKIQVNKTLTSYIVFKGCKSDLKGNCNLTMDITIYQPDGEEYGKMFNMNIWRNRPIPQNNSLGLSIDFLRLTIEPNEQIGTYKIDVLIKDNIDNNRIKLSTSFIAYK